MKPGAYEEYGELAAHLRFVERSSRKLARSTFYAMGRWQAKLEKRQAVLGRIVDIGAELFAIASAVVYATTIRAEHPERAAEAAELADLFCKQAERRVGALFGALWSNDDVDNYALAQRVLEGRYTFLEEGVRRPGRRRRRPSAPASPAPRPRRRPCGPGRRGPGPSRRAAPRRAARACRASARRPPR